MEIKNLLIEDTTKEERIRIVQEGLNQCGGAVISVMVATTWVADPWIFFMNRILTEKKNCVRLTKSTEKIWDL